MARDHRASQSLMLFLPPGELSGTGYKFEIMNCLASPGGREGAGVSVCVCVHGWRCGGGTGHRPVVEETRTE